jgi:hypothetical protein
MTYRQHKVTSSNIVMIGHNSETEELDVQYSSGTTYRFAPVYELMVNDLLAAPSIGSHLHRIVRLATGSGRRLSKEEERWNT